MESNLNRNTLSSVNSIDCSRYDRSQYVGYSTRKAQASNARFASCNPKPIFGKGAPSQRRSSEPHALKLAGMLFFSAIIIVLVCAIALSLADNKEAHGSASWVGEDARSLSVESTPANEWVKGKTPYLYQGDPQWAGVAYAEDTIETSGCGPTCAAMVYVKLTGKKDVTPREMASYATSAGYVDSGKTSWTFMSQGLARYGLQATELGADASVIRNQLKAGHPIICSVRKGDFTTQGHFIVICGLNSDGTVEIRDPNSNAKSHMNWEIDRILKQCNNLWAFSAR